MKRYIAALVIASLTALAPVRPAHATHDFPEHWDEGAPFDLTGADEINRQIVLTGGGTFTREALTTFLDEALLPVSNSPDLELLWTNGIGVKADLALTPDTPDGNYNFLDVTIETVVAMVADFTGTRAKGGVVVRHTGPEEIGGRKFYSAYAVITDIGGAVQVQLFLQKWFNLGFVDLDSGPAVSALFPASAGENFRVRLQVSEPDVDHISHLTADLERLSVVGGVVVSEALAALEGDDRAFEFGQVGLYAEAGSLRTEIAFDDNSVLVSGVVPVTPTSWGALKARYRE